MRVRRILLFSVYAFMAVFVVYVELFSLDPDEMTGDILSVQSLQRMAAPGEMSRAHAFIENKCAACHTPIKGVEAQNCIVCHANEQSLLQRQPTAFHANVASCVECHVEHQGANRRPTQMDHTKLGVLGLRMMDGRTNSNSDEVARRVRSFSSNSAGAPDHRVTPQEAALSCIACHSNEDRHRGFFGTDCIQCHATTEWTITEFRHPAPSSTSCVQCHQAPPSHYMMHFQMVSAKVAGQVHAQVSDCFKCHQTTSWNDIKGVGWYKHH